MAQASILTPALASHTEHASVERSSSLLRMAVRNELLAVPIENVREILQMSRLTPLPRTPDFVRGVMNLRGSVVPVIDLAARLDCGVTEWGRRSCIVVVEFDDSSAEAENRGKPLVIGLMVDAVFEVFDRADHEIESAPGLGTAIAPQFLRGITRTAGHLIGVLALPQVLSADELARCIAEHQPH